MSRKLTAAERKVLSFQALLRIRDARIAQLESDLARARAYARDILAAPAYNRSQRNALIREYRNYGGSAAARELMKMDVDQIREMARQQASGGTPDGGGFRTKIPESAWQPYRQSRVE